MKLQKYKNKNKTYILHRTHSLQTARRSLPRKLTHHFWICIPILAIRSIVNSTTIHSFPVKVDFEVRISSHFGGSACRVKQFPLPPTICSTNEASGGPTRKNEDCFQVKNGNYYYYHDYDVSSDGYKSFSTQLLRNDRSTSQLYTWMYCSSGRTIW